MKLLSLTLIAALAAASAQAAPHPRRPYVKPHMTGRLHTSVYPLGPNRRGPSLKLPGFTQRPVLPGRVAPEPFLQNNLPPVFAPQPAP